MPLVNFNPEAIQKGYEQDIADFNSEQKSNLSYETLASIDIKYIITNMDALLQSVTSTTGAQDSLHSIPNSIQEVSFEYSHDIYNILAHNPDSAKKLWVLRHTLCFKILQLTYTEMILLFKKSEVEKFKLGIWGTKNVTSDIDIGFQNSEIEKRTAGIISETIKIFEELFITHTNKNTLSFDIEPYADMMYIDTDTGSLFYCDTTDFDINDLIQLMPSIGASIIRNYIQSNIDLGKVKDLRRYKSNNQINQDERVKLTEVINKIDFSEIAEIKLLKRYIQKFENIFNNNMKWISEAKEIATGYLTNIYDTTRNKYYELVKNVEIILAKNPSLFISSDNLPDKKLRINLMNQIALALNYRAESHVSPATIAHVVRVIQAKETLDIGKPCNTMRFPKSKAQCTLGEIGYITSVIENIGFLIRFRLTYCENNPTEEYKQKCAKKINKYLPRLMAGLEKISPQFAEIYKEYLKIPTVMLGGRHSRDLMATLPLNELKGNLRRCKTRSQIGSKKIKTRKKRKAKSSRKKNSDLFS